ncbi:MAG: hypothetical protein ACRENG_02405 [bacterium]
MKGIFVSILKGIFDEIKEFLLRSRTMKRLIFFSSIANGITLLLAPLIIFGQTYTNIQITTNTNDQSETAIAIDPSIAKSS